MAVFTSIKYPDYCPLGPISLKLTCFIVGAGMSINAHAAPSFQGLGDLTGGAFNSKASAVSANGLVVVGSASSASGTEAFRWSLADGMVALGDLPGGSFLSEAKDVSADGSVIVGAGWSTSGPEAFRWVAGGGMSGLGDLPGGTFNSLADGVSADGVAAVGTSSSGQGTNAEAFRWAQSDGVTALGSLPGPIFESSALDISGDGTVIVGTSISSTGNLSAYRWTEADGMVALDTSSNAEDVASTARAISTDGSAIVGWRDNQAYRWTSSEGIVAIGQLLGGDQNTSEAWGVSGDGAAVVGQSRLVFQTGPFSFDIEDHAFIWDPVSGMRELQSVLTGLGLDLTGWTLETATGISDDGLTIVGTGINPDGNTEAFIARLPEPGAAGVVLAGLMLMSGARKHR